MLHYYYAHHDASQAGPDRRMAGVRAVVVAHGPGVGPPPQPAGAERAPARGSLARISMNPLPALPVVAHALIKRNRATEIDFFFE